MVQRKTHTAQDASAKKVAEKESAARAKATLEKQEARAKEHPRIWPVSAPRLVRRAAPPVAQIVATPEQVRL